MKKIICLLMMFGFTGCAVPAFNIETGQHTGIISDITEHGVFWRTTTLEIMSGNGNANRSYDFAVESSEILSKLKEAQNAHKEVVIHFKDRRWFMPWHSDWAIVESVEIVNN